MSLPQRISPPKGHYDRPSNKTPRRNADDVAFHLRNVEHTLERLAGQVRMRDSRVTLQQVRSALDEVLSVVPALQRAVTREEQARRDAL